MVLSDDNIKKFQDIYLEKLGKDIPKEDAYEQGIKLLTLMKSIYRPMTIEQLENVEQHRKNTADILTNNKLIT